MEPWLIWSILGSVLILLEFIVPGGIVVFLGLAAILVGGSIYAQWITSLTSALLTWFISSIFFMLFLRSVFIKYFEGDAKVHNVDEDEDILGAIVEIIEDVCPYKEGRVKFQDSTWVARSDEELLMGSNAVILRRDGNTLIIRSL